VVDVSHGCSNLPTPVVRLCCNRIAAMQSVRSTLGANHRHHLAPKPAVDLEIAVDREHANR
jgi:hypothetical protein